MNLMPTNEEASAPGEKEATGGMRKESAWLGSQEQMRAYFEAQPECLKLLEADGTLREINPAGLAIIEADCPATVIGKSVLPLVLPEYQAAFQAMLTAAAAGAKSSLEFQMVGLHGTPRWLDIHSVPLRDPATGKIMVLAVSRDITARKLADNAVRASEKKFGKIFNSSPIAMTLSTLDEGRYLDVNLEFLRLVQKTRAEVIGHTSLELGIWESSEQRTAIIARIKEQGAVRNVELDIRRPSGQIAHILWSAEVVEIDGERCLLGSSLDITERTVVKAELRRKTLFLEALVDSAPDGMAVVDNQGIRLFQNQRMIELWNIPAPLAGNPVHAFQLNFCAEQTKYPREFLDKVAYLYDRPEEVSRDEIELANGVVLDRFSSPVRDKAGQYYGRIWTFRDITERKILEAQVRRSQKMEAFGQLAAGVAHDFNNILAVIQLQAGLVKEEPNLTQALIDYADGIDQAALRAANLTRQLLLFSRKHAMQPHEFNLNEAVGNLTKMLQRTLGELVELQFKFAPGDIFIKADPGMIDQILLNLAVNARDAMPKGGLIIIETATVEFTEVTPTPFGQTRPGPFVCLSVTDAGSGIDPEILPRIFEPFFTTKDVGKGTGLGLATVLGIVQQHKGWLTVESEINRGTTFRVYLPRLARVTDQPVGSPAPAAIGGGHETILLVEDEPALRHSVRTTLARLGYRVIEAATGRDALEIWAQRRQEIHLLLTDLVMPGGVNGQELAERLREQNPALRVVYTSGYSADIAGWNLLLDAGVNFLAKPYETKQLARVIRNCLDTRPVPPVPR